MDADAIVVTAKVDYTESPLRDLPPIEEDRLRILHQYQLINPNPDDDIIYDRYTTLCHRIFKVKTVSISLVDAHKLRIKSKVGFDNNFSPRSSSFATYNILPEYPHVLVVENALHDKRFSQSPIVIGYPFCRFYAGAAIVVDGVRIGSLSLMDTKLRPDISHEDLLNLFEFAAAISNIMSMKARSFIRLDRPFARNSSERNNALFREWKSINKKNRRKVKPMLQQDLSSINELNLPAETKKTKGRQLLLSETMYNRMSDLQKPSVSDSKEAKDDSIYYDKSYLCLTELESFEKNILSSKDAQKLLCDKHYTLPDNDLEVHIGKDSRQSELALSLCQIEHELIPEVVTGLARLIPPPTATPVMEIEWDLDIELCHNYLLTHSKLLTTCLTSILHQARFLWSAALVAVSYNTNNIPSALIPPITATDNITSSASSTSAVISSPTSPRRLFAGSIVFSIRFSSHTRLCSTTEVYINMDSNSTSTATTTPSTTAPPSDATYNHINSKELCSGALVLSDDQQDQLSKLGGSCKVVDITIEKEDDENENNNHSIRQKEKVVEITLPCDLITTSKNNTAGAAAAYNSNLDSKQEDDTIVLQSYRESNELSENSDETSVIEKYNGTTSSRTGVINHNNVVLPGSAISDVVLPGEQQDEEVSFLQWLRASFYSRLFPRNNADRNRRWNRPLVWPFGSPPTALIYYRPSTITGLNERKENSQNES